MFICLFAMLQREMSIVVFTNSAFMQQRVLFANEPFLRKMLASFLALTFPYTLKRSVGKIMQGSGDDT